MMMNPVVDDAKLNSDTAFGVCVFSEYEDDYGKTIIILEHEIFESMCMAWS